jgi:hypothetical protein
MGGMMWSQRNGGTTNKDQRETKNSHTIQSTLHWILGGNQWHKDFHAINCFFGEIKDDLIVAEKARNK